MMKSIGKKIVINLADYDYRASSTTTTTKSSTESEPEPQSELITKESSGSIQTNASSKTKTSSTEKKPKAPKQFRRLSEWCEAVSPDKSGRTRKHFLRTNTTPSLSGKPPSLKQCGSNCLKSTKVSLSLSTGAKLSILMMTNARFLCECYLNMVFRRPSIFSRC